MPPAQNTLVVYTDGTVLEGNNFGTEVFDNPDVHRVFVGGYKHVCMEEDDPLSFLALQAAGYECWLPTMDVYEPTDLYTDEYPVVDEEAEAEARLAAARAARDARIAVLQTEIDALEGLDL
jgi:hypothetical protein